MKTRNLIILFFLLSFSTIFLFTLPQWKNDDVKNNLEDNFIEKNCFPGFSI